MTKRDRADELREEAERFEREQERPDADDLAYVRVRRYVKEPSQVYAIRIPVSRLEEFRRLAQEAGEQPASLMREWVLERLDEETSGSRLRRLAQYAAARRWDVAAETLPPEAMGFATAVPAPAPRKSSGRARNTPKKAPSRTSSKSRAATTKTRRSTGKTRRTK